MQYYNEKGAYIYYFVNISNCKGPLDVVHLLNYKKREGYVINDNERNEKSSELCVIKATFQIVIVPDDNSGTLAKYLKRNIVLSYINL